MALKDDLIKQYKDKFWDEARAREALLLERLAADKRDIETGLKNMYPAIDWHVWHVEAMTSGWHRVSGDDVAFWVEVVGLSHDWIVFVDESSYTKAITVQVRKRSSSIIVNKAQFDLALGQLFAEQEA